MNKELYLRRRRIALQEESWVCPTSVHSASRISIYLDLEAGTEACSPKLFSFVVYFLEAGLGWRWSVVYGKVQE